VAGAAGLTPLVGRQAEVSLLLERWTQSQDGPGQVILLSGEAGIGKSRLVRVLTARAVAEGALRLTVHCSPYHTHSAFYPVIDHLQRRLRWHRDTPSAARLTTLEEAIRAVRLPLEEIVPLVATLLAVPVPERYPPLTFSPQRQKQKTQEALVAWLLAETVQHPVLAVWEDLHWADPSTLELLGLLLDQVTTARLLLVLTARPEFRPPWGPRSSVTPLTLTRLERSLVEEMVLRATGGKPLPAEVVQQIVAKTDGIPLFVEELVKTILESGLVREETERYVLTGPVPPLAIPATLQDALMARLDRLAPVKEVAQLGAVLGREFAYEVLRAVTPLDDATLQQALTQLLEAELLYQHGHPPQATYLFKHALVQDAAYQALLRSTRQQYHQRIAQVLEAQFPEVVNTQPEVLAHHYTEAGLAAPAIPYWQRAGQHASERSAYLEASSHFTRGIELLAALPDTPQRAQQELTLRIAIGIPLIATRGYTAPDVEHTYSRALELCHHVGETPQLFPAMAGLCIFYMVRGELRTARQLSARFLHLVQEAQDAALFPEAHTGAGVTTYYLGDLVAAREHCEHGLALYARVPHRARAILYQDPQAACLIHAALALWSLGYPDQALRRHDEALAVAQQLAHPYTLVWTLDNAARFGQFCHAAPRVTQERAETVIAVAAEHGFPFSTACGTLLRGWAMAMQGHSEAGLAQMRQGWGALRTIGARLSWSYWLGLLAEAYGYGGQSAEGLALLAEAFAVVDDTGQRFYAAELYRLQGELQLQHAASDAPQAEACFGQALELARQQQAKAWELRAAMSLARLWQQQGRRAEAHALLAPVYHWFTEGFDTADLQEARALLAALA
jgi:predicted ATPase